MIQVAVIGLGMMGRNHLRVLHDLEGVKLVAVCDEDANAAQAAAQKYSVEGFTSWRELVDRKGLDAAVVAVPTRAHLEVAREALDRGLHVLLEKPIAADLDQGRELIETAKRNGRLLAVGHVERFNPAVRELVARIGAGDLGRIFQVQSRRQGPFPQRIRDVGVVIDLGTHDLDVLRHIVGYDVTRLYAETEQRIHTEHEDMLNAVLRFDNGVIGVVQVNWLSPVKVRELSVLGEGGLFHVDYLTQELTLFKNAHADSTLDPARPIDTVTEGEVIQYPITSAEPLRLELNSFMEAVSGKGEVEVGGEDGLHALHLALALVQSASEHRVFDRGDLAQLWSRPLRARMA